MNIDHRLAEADDPSWPTLTNTGRRPRGKARRAGVDANSTCVRAADGLGRPRRTPDIRLRPTGLPLQEKTTSVETLPRRRDVAVSRTAPLCRVARSTARARP